MIALSAHGARTFPDPPRGLGDIDTTAVLDHSPEESVIEIIRETQAGIEREHSIYADTRFLLMGDLTQPALLNGCRIVFSIQTREVVISKRGAGHWGLSNLPARWHPAIRAAERAYDGEADSADAACRETEGRYGALRSVR